MRTALALVLAAGVAGSARAEAPLAGEVRLHFDGERDQGVAWLGFGAASLVAGGALVERSDAAPRAAAWPLLALGAVEAAMGMWLLGASDGRSADLGRELGAAPELVRARELQRIRRTERALVLLRVGEVVLCGASVATAIAGAATHTDFATGFGSGLAVESAVLFLLDTFHARRAHRYVRALAGGI